MNRTERRLFKLNDELQRLHREARVTEDELAAYRHIDDDTVRDSLVSGLPADRAEARQTGKDVAALEASLADIEHQIRRLERDRERLLGRLG